jgi:hypothetical protein
VEWKHYEEFKNWLINPAGHQHLREDDSSESSGLWSAVHKGWRERVAADPEFPFKVLIEQASGAICPLC